jgi:hypothetical protein
VTRLAAAVACAALTAGIAVFRAFEYPFWQDEVGAARVITQAEPIEMLRRVTSTELHPPGFYALCWLLARLGAPVVWGRGVSILAAVALTAVVVLYAQRFVPLWAAVVAGLFTALGWQFVDHSWELRPYSLFALECVLFAITVEATAREPTGKRLSLLAAIVAAGAMTHYFFIFTLIAGSIWLWLGRADKRLFVAIGVGLIPFVVWLPAAFEQYRGGGYSWIGSFEPRGLAEAYASVFYRSAPGYGLGLLVLGVVFAGARTLWQHSAEGRLWALCGVVPVLLAATVWAAGGDIFLPRNLIGAGPFAAVAIVAAFSALPRPLALPATLLVAALIVVTYVDTRGRIVPEYDRVAATLIDQGWTERDPILLFGPRYAYLHPLDWYLPGSRLEISSLNGRPCRRVFVVGVGGQGQALMRHASPIRVRSVRIAVVRYRPLLARQVRARNGAVLATRASGCARVA